MLVESWVSGKPRWYRVYWAGNVAELAQTVWYKKHVFVINTACSTVLLVLKTALNRDCCFWVILNICLLVNVFLGKITVDSKPSNSFIVQNKCIWTSLFLSWLFHLNLYVFGGIIFHLKKFWVIFLQKKCICTGVFRFQNRLCSFWALSCCFSGFVLTLCGCFCGVSNDRSHNSNGK